MAESAPPHLLAHLHLKLFSHLVCIILDFPEIEEGLLLF